MTPSADPPTDAELLVSSGDDAFAEVYRRHASAVLAYHARRTGCPETAADLTAETFAQAFASRHRFADTGAPARAWLFTIARRQLGRFVRREKVSMKYRRRLQLEPVDLSTTDLERIEELADLAGLRADVADALDRLPESQAAAVRLRIGADLPYREVAERLGCSEGAARVRVSRGLVRLTDDLEGP